MLGPGGEDGTITANLSLVLFANCSRILEKGIDLVHFIIALAARLGLVYASFLRI